MTQTAPSPSTSSNQPFFSRPLRVLYADDVPELREFMCMFLSREGHCIETTSDGSAALERLSSALNYFDLVITDHNMPGLNGLELVSRLRELPYMGKIVVFSSELSEAARASYLRCAVDLIVSKPSFPSTLRVMLAQLFQGGLPDGAKA